MRKTFLSRSASSRKQRGVAIVFSLGILGLLTVLALGFASTALLNNSVSKNVMNDAYARTLAKNLALTQALYLINDKAGEADRGFVDYRKIYTYGTESYSTVKDFLWKLDYTDSKVKIYTFDPSGEGIASNPANNVRWQYVKDSAQAKILGRYAYVVVPGRGGTDPSANQGKNRPTASGLTKENIKNLEQYITLGYTINKLNTATDGLRWTTNRELVAKSGWSSTYYPYIFSYYGMYPSWAMKSPEAYWEDGKLYSRFNLNRTDWDTLSPRTLCGADLGTGTLPAEFPEEQTFIPWLKKMYDNDSTRDQALQIAANIIQYNRGAFTKNYAYDQGSASVSDSEDWLAADPTYIGIGRHPMLNELGFMVHVKSSVEAVLDPPSTELPEGQVRYKYTPKYYVTLDVGSELLYQGGNATSTSFGVTNTSEVTLRGNIKVELGKFQEESVLQENLSTLIDSNGVMESDGLLGKATLSVALDAANAPTITAEGDPVTTLTMAGYGWTGFKLSFAKTTSGWNSDPAYTKSSLFWRRQQQPTGQTECKTQCLVIELPSFSLVTGTGMGTGGDISKALAKGMRVESINIDPKKVLLKYNSVNRDFVQNLVPYKMETPCNFKPAEASDPAAEHAWFVAYETTDPLVNLKKEDWTQKTTPETTPAVGTVETLTASPTSYPGSIYDSSGNETHVNNTLTDASFSGTHEEDLLKKYLNYAENEHHDNRSLPEPAFTAGRRLPTGIIRHGQMLSFWELGCISRGKPFETLNLLAKSGSSTDFSYDKGDAALFDQLKLSDNDYTAGKINLNTEHHKVLEQLFFVRENVKYGFMRKNISTSASSSVSAFAFLCDVHDSTSHNLLAAGSTNYEDDIPPVAVYSQSKGEYTNSTKHDDTCLICQLLDVTAQYSFQNRGDLLLFHADLPTEGGTKPDEAKWKAIRKLFLLPGDNSEDPDYTYDYLEKIQTVSKIMPILRAEPADVLYVVILAQSIKDMGGDVPVMRDWNGTGIETAISGTTPKNRAYYMAGFRRSVSSTKIFDSEPALSGTESEDGSTPLLLKLYTKNRFGQYDLGSDKITGEARLVATLVRDPETRKWKLLRVQNVD